MPVTTYKTYAVSTLMCYGLTVFFKMKINTAYERHSVTKA
jgi:hypothetical protein